MGERAARLRFGGLKPRYTRNGISERWVASYVELMNKVLPAWDSWAGKPIQAHGCKLKSWWFDSILVHKGGTEFYYFASGSWPA